MRIRKGDNVLILCGQSRGKTGRVLFVIPDKDQVLVEGLNLRKKHQKPTQKSPKGGIISKEAPIHISNVALHVSGSKGPRPTRLSSRIIEDGGKRTKVRISRVTGEQI
ncbi:MAG: 50S ribosomal protein L24 [candidate division Zixibacteria bacterium]|nr:50S ribosomal protein L24 [candidate division Zixibacteria bacterium]